MAENTFASRSHGSRAREQVLWSTVSVYLATGVCFCAGIVRDWTASTLPGSGREFFEAVYVASFASTWGINAIQLGTSPPTRRLTFRMAGLSVIIVLVAWLALPALSTAAVVTTLAVSILWLAGAVASRAQLASGFPFSARAREAVASLSIAAFIVVGINGFASLACGVAIGTVWMLAVSWRSRARYFLEGQGGSVRSSTIKVVIASNASVAIMTLWGIYVNQLDALLLGVSAQWAARLASYLFQIISVGWVVLAVNPELAPRWMSRHGTTLSVSLFAAAAACTAWNVEASCLVMPIFAGIGQYTLIAASARDRPL
jgi:hypothetical protein